MNEERHHGGEKANHAELRGMERLRWYGVGGLVTLLLDVVTTRMFFAEARIVRRPAYVRGRPWMHLGKGLTTGRRMRLDAIPSDGNRGVLLTLGDDVQVNESVHIAAHHSVRIGNRVLLASNVFITDHNHGTYSGEGVHSDPRSAPALRPVTMAPVVVEDDVWVGEYVTILPGVTVGRGSVIGSMSVVTRDVPEYCIAVGSPARVIKRYDFETARWVRV